MEEENEYGCPWVNSVILSSFSSVTTTAGRLYMSESLREFKSLASTPKRVFCVLLSPKEFSIIPFWNFPYILRDGKEYWLSGSDCNSNLYPLYIMGFNDPGCKLLSNSAFAKAFAALLSDVKGPGVIAFITACLPRIASPTPLIFSGVKFSKSPPKSNKILIRINTCVALSNIGSNIDNFATIGLILLWIPLIPWSAAVIGPPSLVKESSIVIKVSVNPLITLTGIPTPGGTEVGIGNALIIVTTVFKVGITWFRVLTNFAIVSIGLRTVFKAPDRVFLISIFLFNIPSISSKISLISFFCGSGICFRAFPATE